jgi:SagB-type dehydrogenase family enzyme
VYATRVRDLASGLYHFNPETWNLDVLRGADESAHLAACTFQPDLVQSAAAVLMVSAIFLRSTFKYGDRGYRFALLETGHLAQNAILTAGEMGLAAAPVGGYVDRDVDDFIGCNGLDESVLYLLLVGQSPSVADPAHQHE